MELIPRFHAGIEPNSGIWSGKEGHTARFQQTANLGEVHVIGRYMLDNLKARHKIEACCWSGGCRLAIEENQMNCAADALTRQFDSLRGYVQPRNVVAPQSSHDLNSVAVVTAPVQYSFSDSKTSSLLVSAQMD